MSRQASRSPAGDTLLGAPPPKDMLLLAMAGLIFVAIASFIWSLWVPRAFFATFGIAALIVVLIPLARRPTSYDTISLWTFTCVGIFISATLRGVYVAAGRPDEAALQDLYFRGEPDSFFMGASFLVLATLLIMAVTYTRTIVLMSTKPPVEALANYRFNPLSLRLFVGIFALLGLVTFYRFAQETGGLDLLRPSMKRAASPGLNVPEDWQTYGYLRQGEGLSAISFFALLAYYARERLPMLPWRLPLLSLLFLNAALMPFYTSSRAGAMWLILSSVAVLYYAGKRIRPHHIIVGAVLALFVFFIMSFLRSAEVSGLDELEGSSPANMLDSLVLTRNMIDPFVTAHVINNVPDKLEWKNGETLYGWLLTPIPRELWPGKPRINIGPEVGVIVYGSTGSGVPPGLPGEMYWNLAYPGVLLGALLLGLALAYLHVKFCPRDTKNMALILIYCGALVQLGPSVLGTAVGQAVFRTSLLTAQALMFLWCVSSQRTWIKRR